MILSKDHETQRKQIWVEAWLALAGAIGCSTSMRATKWADDCLESFDKRFPKPEQYTHGEAMTR